MWILIGTIAVASLLGSMHCVGMCGPLAMWASGITESRRGLTVNTTLYHFGRLVTYAIAGGVAGLIGEITNVGGQVLGLQTLAARIVGVLMIAIGIWKLGNLVLPGLLKRSPQVSQANLKLVKPSGISGFLVKLRPYVFSLPASGRALATGLLTALLPCGWLYLFAIVAAGTGSVMDGMIVMIAFWIGTVPALISLVVGASLLSRNVKRMVPVAAALLLVVAGGYTAFGRGFADLGSLSHSKVARLAASVSNTESKTTVQFDPEASELRSTSASVNVQSLLNTPLPCCDRKTENEDGN
jgi:uncharacterized protein